MRIFDATYQHPAQASRVRLRVFAPPDGSCLALEAWEGASTVIKTLGLFDDRDAAVARVGEREAELRHEGFSRVAPAA
jgi:hypothetical protein